MRRCIYKFLNMCPFGYMAVAGSEKACEAVYHTSWMPVATPYNCPSRSAITMLSNFLIPYPVLSICLFDISVGIRTFAIGLSQISSFFFSCFDVDIKVLCPLAIALHWNYEPILIVNVQRKKNDKGTATLMAHIDPVFNLRFWRKRGSSV